MKRLFGIVLCLALALPMMAQEETLCTDGTLLFREDFGGNDPNDPRVRATPVNGMTYPQLLTDAWQSMGSGKYLVTKSGYCNGDTSMTNLPRNRSSQWHLQDDHTYPNDKTRGYLLEIDGRGDNSAFYSTTIDGLCEGSKLTFSAYVANVLTWGMYVGQPGRYAYPRLKFVLTDPMTNEELATYDTGDIPFDSAFIGDYACWKQSVEWRLVGMNFTVPSGKNRVKLTIYNNTTGTTGNDFAMDDIEIHLCAPPVTIEGETEVCENTATTLTANFTNDGTFAEPLAYKWWHSADSLTWSEISDFNGGILTFNAIQKADSGWYKVAVSGDGNIENINCRAMSEPFLLTVKECVPLLPVTITIISPDSVCPNDPYTFEVVIENEDQLEAPTDFQWWYRSPEYPTVWNKVSGGNQRDLQIASFKAQHVGWYKLQAAGHGLIDIEQYCVESEEYYVTFKKCEPDLCLDGSLLYRDDFGGNDPNDPEVISDANAARAAVPGMSSNYTPCLSRTSGMSSGKFLITKHGYKNGIQWHLMDDHTYPEDLTKGYILQIDGRGDDAPFYTTTIDGLCSGSRLTFSAYVANVHYCGEIQKFYRLGQSYIYPRMKFVLKDPQNGQTLATQYTDDIQPDANKEWDINLGESAEWRLIGMEFTVPEGVESIQMYIYNDVNHNGTGNDFALDDIEIHLCTPPVTIEGETEVCENTATTLTANFTNDGTFAEPLEYKWWHSADSLTWTEISGFNGGILSFDAIQKADSGWYKVAVSGDGNIESVNCRAMSEPFRLRVNECEPPEPPEPPEQELCSEGLLLFREDFGGNDPNDPIVGTDRVSGMDYSRYTQRLNADHVTGQAGLFWLIKSGYYHADTTRGRDPMKNHSNWYLQDDHTYPNDKTRGYLLEIDGLGGTAPFYSTVVHGVCPGTRLTFSAYVANVNKASNYIDGVHARIYPKLKFEIADAKTHTVLGSHSTGDIPYDPDLTVNTDFWYSSKWYLHGMTFTMPEAVDSIRLTIYNDVMNNGAGNDFALDDIEIRLCMTPDTIRTDTTVCDTVSRITWRSKEFALADTLRDTLPSSCGFDSIYYELHIETAPCVEELCIDGILLFREDFGGNDPNDPQVSRQPVSGMTYTQVFAPETGAPGGNMRGGCYLVTKEGYRNSDNKNYSCWHIMDDHTYPNDKTRGYLMEVDALGSGNNEFFCTTIDGLCAGNRLTFSAYVANLTTAGQYLAWISRNYVHPKLSFIITDPDTNTELARYNTDTIGHDWEPSVIDGSVRKKWQESADWQLVGMNFTVPEGVYSVRLAIRNNALGSTTGNDFALDDIEIHLCTPPVTIEGETEVCENTATTLTANFTNDGTFAEPLVYKWWHSTDSVTWLEMSGFNGEILTFSTIQKADSGWYKVAVSGDGNIESVNCRAMSEPFRLKVNECEPPEPPEPPTPPVPPCPEVLTVTADTTVCDTLMPFTWRGMVFEEAGEKRWMEKSPRDCDSIEHVYTLSTIHCEKPEPPTPPEPPDPPLPPDPPQPADTLFEIIVNKYDWQLLCNNVALRNYFPAQTATAFQWYKNEQAIPGATSDDYSEHNELQGVFQLNVRLDDGRSIWSNIIEIEGPAEAPVRVQIYNSQGMPVNEGQLTRGVYLYRYEKGEEVWTEKKIVL